MVFKRTSSSFDPRERAGFTLTDMLVMVAVITVLSAIGIVAVNNGQEKTRLAQCTGNLNEVGQAILKFCDDNNKTTPAMVEGQGNVWWWYKEQVKRYAGLTGASSANDKIFACPGDRGYTDAVPFCRNSRFDYTSYVYNGVILPGMPNIAGLQTFAIKQPQKTLLAMEFCAHAPLSWHYSKTGKKNMPFYCDAQSVVSFVDGHVAFCKFYYDGYNAAYTQDPIPGYDYKFSGN